MAISHTVTAIVIAMITTTMIATENFKNLGTVHSEKQF